MPATLTYKDCFCFFHLCTKPNVRGTSVCNHITEPGAVRTQQAHFVGLILLSRAELFNIGRALEAPYKSFTKVECGRYRYRFRTCGQALATRPIRPIRHSQTVV